MLILPQDKDIFSDDKDILPYEKAQLYAFVESKTKNISIQSSMKSKQIIHSETGLEEDIYTEYSGETNIKDMYFSRMDSAIHEYMLSKATMPCCFINPHVSKDFFMIHKERRIYEYNGEIEEKEEEEQREINIEFDFFEYAQRLWNSSSDSPMVWSYLNSLDDKIKDAKIVKKGLSISLLKGFLVGISGPILYIIVGMLLTSLIANVPNMMFILSIVLGPIAIILSIWSYCSIPIGVISTINKIKKYSKLKKELPNTFKNFPIIALKMHRYIRYRIYWYHKEHPAQELPEYLVNMTECLNSLVEEMNELYGDQLYFYQ